MEYGKRIECHALVQRMGEMFGEFGFRIDSKHCEDDIVNVTKWQLQVRKEEVCDDETAPLHNMELPVQKTHKVVKLSASSFYLVRVRLYSEDTGLWGPWSASIRTGTLPTVRAQIKEIGEDYVYILWNRPMRDSSSIAEEVDIDATRSIAEIVDFELRILRESDMTQVFCDRFETGVRAHTVRSLYPGTAYIVMIRYGTLLNTMKNWMEIGRFLTCQVNVMSLLSRGEDVITVGWTLTSNPDDIVGYVIPESAVHRYEVIVQSDGEMFRPVEFPPHVHSYRIDKLSPGGKYSFSVRSLSVQGYWGRRSDPLSIRTAGRPELCVVASGESFLSFSWMRHVDPETDTQVEYRLTGVMTAYKQEGRLDVGPLPEDRVIHMQGLTPGTEYFFSIRTFLNNEWGLWTEPQKFCTEARAGLSLLERGEDFVTVMLEGLCNGSRSPRFNLVVTRVDDDERLTLVRDEEITPEEDNCVFTVVKLKPNTVYLLKCRSFQHNRITGYEGWGEFTEPKQVQTLRPLVVRLWDIGEDFAQIVWRCGLSKSSAPTGAPDGVPHEGWSDLKYELRVDCVDSGEKEILCEEILGTNYKIGNLKPATTYIVSVRACNDLEQWGLWSQVKLRTLAPVVTSVDEIGEDFIRLMWQRQVIEDVIMSDDDAVGDASEADDGNDRLATATADMFVSRYAVFVCSCENMESSPSSLSGYHMGGNSEVTQYMTVSSEHTSLRVGELLPDREYVAVVRASTATGMWGLWSQPLRFRSNPQFRIPVNNLIIGENYVNIVWSRDTHPVTQKDVFLGNLTVTRQQLRIQSVDASYSKDHSLPADMRELRIYGLSPATAYSIQIRASGQSGDWGLWSPPVYILTRDTILTKAVEVADDYAIVAWERRRLANPKNYPTGRGAVTSYHLRVYNVGGIVFEAFLGDGDSPYRISNLQPDTYYCIDIKANYNDEEWGSWSSPLWCLTMMSLQVETKTISEEFCCISIRRPRQTARSPEDDGNRFSEDSIVTFGQPRTCLMLCVTSPVTNVQPHSSAGHLKPRVQNTSLPPNAADHRLIYQTEIVSGSVITDHKIPNLRANTVYCVSVRSKLINGEWGMWSFPPLLFATVPPTQVDFTDIGENFINIEWKRSEQIIPPQIDDSSRVKLQPRSVVASRVKIRELDGDFCRVLDVNNPDTSLHIEDLNSSTTYGIAVQTCGDDSVWGVWSEEAKVRTIPGMDIVIHHISEDAVWVSWSRMSDTSNVVSFDTTLNTDVVARTYEVRILGDGHFRFHKEVQGRTFFFRGLLPDAVYRFEVRARCSEMQSWGIWATRSFHTKPRLRVTFGNVGEHFAIVEWRRHLPSCLDRHDASTVVESEDVVQQFRLKVMRVGDTVPYIYDLSPFISSFRLKDLQPSAEYRVWLCAKGHEGVWGFWNEESRVRTFPKLQLEITSIGEEYVTVSWSRPKWANENSSEGETDSRAMESAASGYKVRVLNRAGEEVISQYFSFRQTSCTLSSLQRSTVYSVEVSAKDTYDELGLWSDPKHFMTLEAVDVNALLIGETFVKVEWARQSELKRRRRLNSLQDSGSDENSGSAFSGSGSDDGVIEDSDFDTPGGEAVNCGHDNLVGSLRKGIKGLRCVDLTGSSSEEGEDHDVENDCTMDGVVIRGAAEALQWHIRMESRCVLGGQPEAEHCVDFFAQGDEVERLVDHLQPNSEYTLAVQAQDQNGTWGHWSEPRTLVTCPRLKITADSITETFVNVSWTRPPMLSDSLGGLCCYPKETDIHNYQVHIKPLPSEEPFDERDEPLVDGARLYETSQRSLRLCNLTPGAHYRIVVREQLVDSRGRFVPSTWGSASQTTVVEMVHAMGIVPIEIGENYCLLGWRRVPRAPDTTPAISVIRGVVKVTAYELRVTRLDGKAKEKYEGPLSLDTVIPLESSVTSYHLGNLVSNTIYAVSMRAKAEGYWGPWSKVTKFVSQGRLQIKVHSVYEDVMLVSWSRPLPDWAHTRRDSNSMTNGESPPGSQADDPHEVDTLDQATTNTASTKLGSHDVRKGQDVSDNNSDAEDSNDWDAVQLGDYSIQRYELYLEGITCEMQQCLTLSKYQMSVRISGLQANQIYSVCVRSQSEKQHWSMLSRRESVLTLTPIATEVSHCTEDMAIIRWFRIRQDIKMYESFLEERRREEERICDERERHELFDMKRRLQELEDSEERDNLCDHLKLRHEHNAAVRMDAIHYLQIENIVQGDAETTGFHFRFYGGGVMPLIQGLNHMLLQSQCPKGSHGRKRRTDTSRSLNRTRRHHQRSSPEATGAYSMECAQITSLHIPAIQSEVTQAAGAADDGEEVGALGGRRTMFDVQLRSEVFSVTLKGLSPNSSFEVEVCTRNIAGDWCPWSERTRFSTLRPIELQQERFGEHYINLYWHRLPQSVSDEIESDERQLLELNEEFANMSPQDLKKKEQELSREDYEILLSRIKKLRDLKQSVQEKRSWLSSGQGEVVVHEHTPVKGYQLRVIHQNGTFQDYYVADKNDESADSAVRRAFTITGLVWNTMYTAILCCDYGVGWGPWTKPLKFVTQNLIQMSIMYISETFVDIEWRRAPNTRLPAINEGDTLRSDPASNEGRVCQVRITWEDEVEAKDGEAKIKEEYREMHSCCVFRVDKLLTDTKYTFEVREWGAQGDWGLWCAPKTCVTIPAMSVAVTKLGEDWAHITWNRLDRRVDYDNDINVLQHGVDNEIYYLRVAELQDNGIEGEDFQVPMVEEEEHTPATLVDDIAGVLTAQRNTYNSLPAQEHPVECETDGSGRFYLIRRFDKTISSYLVGNLRHDRFYSAQVVCVTTGGQLGSWSPEQYFLTMSRIQVEARHIDERYANIEWRRSPPRKHPRLSMASVFTGSYVTKEYIVELSGRDGFHLIGKLIGADSTEYQFENLSIDTVYKVAVSSVSEDDTHSLWSEPLRFVTLPRVTIYPTQITEHWITLEWGRGEQKPFGDEGTEYEGRHDPTIKVGSGLCSSYLLRIDQGGDGVKRLLEKQLPGNVNTFHLESLTPNTPYTINIRPANILGEWGFWSGERCVYTMKLIHVDVLATGEDYVRLHWGRGEPDELQTVDCVAYVSGNSSISSGDEERLEEDDGEHDGSEKSPTTVGESSRSVGEPSDDLFGSADSVTEAQPAAEDDGTFQNLTKGNEKALELKKLPLRKKYPLLDRPEKKSSMYNSTKTHITGYAITIIREGEDEGYTLDVPGGKTTFTVPSLLPDKRYLFAVRACYGGSDWGPISPHIACGTLNLLNVELTGLGEDYLTAAWQRLPNTFNVSEVTHMDQEELLCYELAVHDFTDVSLGEEDNEELPPRLRRAVMVPANVRRCTVRELLPHHRYRVSVRRWYKPHEAFLNNAPHSEFPQIEDDDVKEVLLREKAEAGAWSDGLYDVTMSEMVCFMDDGAEDFFAVRWERDTSALPLPVRNPFPQKPVDGYQLRVYDMGPIVSTLEGGEGLLLTDLTLSGADSTYAARNLRHDSLYRVHVRCCVDNVWGRWSRIVHVMTLPKFVVEMNSIGENYAEFSWQRPRRSLTLPDGSEAFCGNDDNLSMFQVEVAGIEHSYHINKQFKGVRNSYRAKMLEADTVYSVSVRAIDSRRDTWNPWNDRTYFVTLKPMRLVVYPPGEQFVTVEWFRDEQTVQDYADIVGVSSGHGPIGNSVDTFPVTSSPTTAAVPIHLGSPDVIAYHLCIFAGQHTPAVAVVDKQFPKDLNRYTVCSLDPDTPYVAVVRACNVDSRWGLWSKEGLFHTQCILKLSILRVGEIYATIKWERGEGDRQDEKHNPGKRLEPCEYQLLLKSGTETFERTVYPSDCGVTDEESLPTYMLGDLAPGSEYVMALQPRYDETRWGRWTHTVGFKTIYPIAVNVNEVAGNAVKFSVQRTLPPPTPIPSPTDAEKVEAKAKKNSKGGKGPRGAKTSRARRDSRLDKTGRGSPKTLESLPPVPVSQPPLSGRSPIPADSSAVSASTVSFVHGETPESPQKTVENEEPDDGSVDQKICIPVVKKYQVEVRVIERVREGNKALSDDGGSAANTPATVNTPCGVLAGSGGGRSGFGSPREIPQPVVLLPPITNITGGDSTTERIPGEGCGSQTPDTRAVATSEGGIYEDSALRSCYRVMLASTSQDRPHFRELMFDVEKDDPLVKIIEVDNLDYSTSYAIRIRAMDEHDMWGAWVETTIMTAPPPPRCVTLRRQNAQTCLLQWEAPDYHRRYRYVVEQSHYTTDSRGRCRGAIEWRVRDTVEETSCRVRLTAPPAKMRCRVKCALIGEDNIFSDYCEPVALTSGMLPDPVSGLVATRVSCNRVSLAWRPSRTETMSAGRSADRNVTYRIYVGVYNCTPILVCAVPDTTHTLEGLEPSKTYTIQVVTECNDGISYNNPIVRITTRDENEGSLVLPQIEDAAQGSAAEDQGLPSRSVILPDISLSNHVMIPQPPSRGKVAVGRRGSSARLAASASRGSPNKVRAHSPTTQGTHSSPKPSSEEHRRSGRQVTSAKSS